MACLWGFAGNSGKDNPDNWKRVYGIQDANAFTQYVTCLYWSTMTLSTIGYGDVVATFVGASLYAYIVGAVCGIIASMGQDETDFHQTMDHLNNYMNDVKAPPEMRRRMRQYFHARKSLHKDKYYIEVLDMMSPGLRGQFSCYCHGSWITKIHFFSKSESEATQSIFISSIAQNLRAKAYPAAESVIKRGEPCGNMYIIRKGLIGSQGRIFRVGQYLGEDIILAHATRPYSATTLTFVDCMVLSAKSLVQVLESGEFTAEKETIRLFAIRLSLQYTVREIVRRVRLVRAKFS